ncbi:MAG: hypothetical protein R2823_10505 [Acidimicrobiia bacterium]
MTKDRRDLFEALREGDPARMSNSEQDALLRQRIKSRVLAADRRPLRATRRRILVVALVAAFALASTAAAIYLAREPSDPAGIGCYQAATLDAPQFGVRAPSSLHPSECEQLWADGTLTNPSVVPKGEIPQLVGCVNPAGGLAVFPSNDDQLCDRLGLARYEEPTRTDVVELNVQLLGLFTTEKCMTMDDAQTRVEDILTAQGLSNWSVTVTTPASADRPCASFSLNGSDHTILLVPIPVPPDE